jgi:hypothetical protein
MVEPEVVRQMRLLHEAGWGAKRIAAEVGVARNTVRLYPRSPLADVQVRPSQRSPDDDARSQARELYVGPAGGNAVVVRHKKDSTAFSPRRSRARYASASRCACRLRTSPR